MRFPRTVLLLIGPAGSVHAQQEALISGDATFGSPVVKLSAVSGEPGLFVGGRGGAVINFRRDHVDSLSLSNAGVDRNS